LEWGEVAGFTLEDRRSHGRVAGTHVNVSLESRAVQTITGVVEAELDSHYQVHVRQLPGCVFRRLPDDLINRIDGWRIWTPTFIG
jgi:hypothetical protein